MNIIELIEQKYGDTCRLRSPLTKNQREKAKKFLPGELFDILKVSNGIDEIMINLDNGKTEVIDSIIYSLAEIKKQTNSYLGEIGTDGFVFAGDGAGKFFVLKSDGKVSLYEYYDFSETFYANSLWEFFDKL